VQTVEEEKVQTVEEEKVQTVEEKKAFRRPGNNMR
jgi:hypothetical protein